MDLEKRSRIYNEGVPLNSEGAANIFLNTGKVSSTTVHLKTDSVANPDVDLHINTSFAKSSSKRIKLLFIVNFLLCAMCILISCVLAFCYWRDMVTMRTQLEFIKEHLIADANNKHWARHDNMKTQSKLSSDKDDGLRAEARTYYVNDLGNDPIVFIDSSKKTEDITKKQEPKTSQLTSGGMTVMHFVGAEAETNLGKESVIGPWALDKNISTEDSHANIELSHDSKTFIVKESGFYLMYTQVTYIAHTPNHYAIFARKALEKPRLLVVCSSADVYTKRSASRSQLTCATQTAVRLFKEETVILSQREPNITVWLMPGYSFFGLIRLGQ